MLEIIGWLGGILLATCGVPLAWQSYKTGHSNGISSLFLWMWFFGEALVLIYVFPEFLYPLIVNYSFNIVLVLVIIKFKYFPRSA